ncbi:hypothetical protein, partial [Pseudomonas putida]|uniref:hypothetical protein n=1 Tax=Pseudomonas putida TaxID=303 RepID=UPI001EE3FF0E
HHGWRAPERNRERSIGHQVDAWNVGMMDPLRCNRRDFQYFSLFTCSEQIVLRHVPACVGSSVAVPSPYRNSEISQALPQSIP